jgi:DNA-directed RNA polymerase II subunit RPB2
MIVVKGAHVFMSIPPSLVPSFTAPTPPWNAHPVAHLHKEMDFQLRSRKRNAKSMVFTAPLESALTMLVPHSAGKVADVITKDVTKGEVTIKDEVKVTTKDEVKVTIKDEVEVIKEEVEVTTTDEVEVTTKKVTAEYNVEQAYELLDAYFCGQHLDRLVRHQIESYNYFIMHQLPKTIQMFNTVTIRSENDYVADKGQYYLEIHIRFENFKMYPPQIHENNGATKIMLPQEAKLRNFTYASVMTVDVHIEYVVRNTEAMDTPHILEKVIPKVNIGKMPIMLKSDVCVLHQNRHIHSAFTGECPFDCGGYFIIKGSEKTVLGQERAAENKIYVFEDKGSTKWSWSAKINSVPDYKCISPKQIEMTISSKNNGFGYGLWLHIPRIKAPIELFAVFRALGVMSDKAMCEYVVLNVTDDVVSRQTLLLKKLQASIFDANKWNTAEEALKYISGYAGFTPIKMDGETGNRKRVEFTRDVLDHDLFPHCTTKAQKLYFLGYMASRLLQTSMGWIPTTDRDSYVNKRIDLTGPLLNNLVRNHFNKVVKELQKLTVREINQGSWRSTEDVENIINTTNIDKLIKSTTIENGINRALSTGDFSIKQSNSSKVGVAQVLNRLTYVASLSHLRRINTPLEKSGELIEPRKLHSSTWGYLCSAESPEGQSIGVVKNVSFMTHITIPSHAASLYASILPQLVRVDDVTSPRDLSDKVKVIINGCWVGVTDSPLELYRDIQDKKLRGIINVYTSVVLDYALMEIRVCNDGGRLARPLLRISNKEDEKRRQSSEHHPIDNLVLTREVLDGVKTKDIGWNDLMLTGSRIPEAVVEYIDPEEQNFALVAMRPSPRAAMRPSPTAAMRPAPPKADTDNGLSDTKPVRCMPYTHAEIHPSTIFGVLGSCIPFPEHNQAPRNTYQCAMAKQAIGVYATNYDQRMDKTAYVLTYPSRPLVDTRLMNMIQLNRIPSGCQVHVAIMSHTGYNQEDSVLINQGAIDRGLFLTTIYHTEKDEDKNIIRDQIIRCKPDPVRTKGVKFGNYSKLNAHGFIPENTQVENRDVLIAKIVPIKENRNDPTKIVKYEDQSKTFRTTEETYVDKNFTGRNGDGYNFAKTRIRILRKPVLGDKLASRAAQKGTIGNIIPECDMPFTKEGLRPDIIINPHCIPSRMTIAQLKETLLGKVLIELGLFGDGTSFTELGIPSIAEELQKLGYESCGNELLYNGMTGEQLETSTFIGPVFYQRLKHMVNDKQHSRAIGPMVNLTRQPAEGRSRDGGFRVGEMERDVMLAHGMSRFCRERLYDSSDKYAVHVCNHCGMMAAFNDGKHRRTFAKDDFTVHLCATCDNTTDFSRVEVPYAYKLLSQELQTINVVPRLITAAP